MDSVYFGKENKFARFHVNQAFIFNIAVITSAGIIALLTSIQEVMALADAVSAVVYFIFSAFFAVVVYALLFAACMLIVLGFMNAGFGRTKAVGFLKKIKIFK